MSSKTFARLQTEPSLLESLFFEDDGASVVGIEPEHIGGFDYRLAHEALIAMAEATGEELDDDGDPVLDDLGVSGELDYDAGYGPAFYIEPAAVKKAVDSLASHMDDEVKAVIEGAAAAGDYLVGVIS